MREGYQPQRNKTDNFCFKKKCLVKTNITIIIAIVNSYYLILENENEQH
jgi:hypothetical protein